MVFENYFISIDHPNRFDFEDGPHYEQFNKTDFQKPPSILPGAGHLDQLNYFLPKTYKPFATETEKQISRQLLDMIENFVYGR